MSFWREQAGGELTEGFATVNLVRRTRWAPKVKAGLHPAVQMPSELRIAGRVGFGSFAFKSRIALWKMPNRLR
jgi:hypothetical protein